MLYDADQFKESESREKLIAEFGEHLWMMLVENAAANLHVTTVFYYSDGSDKTAIIKAHIGMIQAILFLFVFLFKLY